MPHECCTLPNSIATFPARSSNSYHHSIILTQEHSSILSEIKVPLLPLWLFQCLCRHYAGYSTPPLEKRSGWSTPRSSFHAIWLVVTKLYARLVTRLPWYSLKKATYRSSGFNHPKWTGDSKQISRMPTSIELTEAPDGHQARVKYWYAPVYTEDVVCLQSGRVGAERTASKQKALPDGQSQAEGKHTVIWCAILPCLVHHSLLRDCKEKGNPQSTMAHVWIDQKVPDASHKTKMK